MTPLYGIVAALPAIAMTPILVATRRRTRSARDPMRHVFGRRELRDLDARLAAVEDDECRRLEESLTAYLAGDAGYVVAVWTASCGVFLELSDRCLFAVSGLSRRVVEPLSRKVQRDILRPRKFYRDAFSCVLIFGEAGGRETRIHARTVVLTGGSARPCR